jgi:hypothetical protein
VKERRGPWYLLTGLVIGAALGLLYAWVINPTQYINTAPNALRADYKDQYRALIASAYLANGDLVRARARLELLKDADLYRVLAEQAQRTLAGGTAPQEARALGLLAVALGQAPSAVSPEADASPSAITPSPTSVSLTATISSTRTITDITLTPAGATPTLNTPLAAGRTSPTAATSSPTATPLPTRTPTATPGAPFALDRQELVCDPSLGGPLIQVETYDAAEQPVPGVEVVVNWEGGEDHFFTGIKSEINPGYADFDMTPGVSYTLRLVDGGQPIKLTASECETSAGDRYWGSWRLIFIQP